MEEIYFFYQSLTKQKIQGCQNINLLTNKPNFYLKLKNKINSVFTNFLDLPVNFLVSSDIFWFNVESHPECCHILSSGCLLKLPPCISKDMFAFCTTILKTSINCSWNREPWSFVEKRKKQSTFHCCWVLLYFRTI